MQPDEELISLIEKATAICGSYAELARRIGVGRQHVNNWLHGHKPCPPEDQALMASIVGADPVAELARAVLRRHEGTPKGDRLMRVLGKALPAIGAAVASAGVHASAIFSIPTASGWDLVAALATMCRRVKFRTRLRFNRSLFC